MRVSFPCFGAKKKYANGTVVYPNYGKWKVLNLYTWVSRARAARQLLFSEGWGAGRDSKRKVAEKRMERQPAVCTAACGVAQCAAACVVAQCSAPLPRVSRLLQYPWLCAGSRPCLCALWIFWAGT